MAWPGLSRKKLASLCCKMESLFFLRNILLNFSCAISKSRDQSQNKESAEIGQKPAKQEIEKIFFPKWASLKYGLSTRLKKNNFLLLQKTYFSYSWSSLSLFSFHCDCGGGDSCPQLHGGSLTSRATRNSASSGRLFRRRVFSRTLHPQFL